MADQQHRATAEHWDLIGRMCHRAEFSCLVELRDRVEALEAAVQPAHPAKPDGSLVKRVKSAINRNRNDVPYGTECAKASIREVAAWLNQESSGHLGSGEYWAIRLEQEAEHR